MWVDYAAIRAAAWLGLKEIAKAGLWLITAVALCGWVVCLGSRSAQLAEPMGANNETCDEEGEPSSDTTSSHFEPSLEQTEGEPDE